MKVDSARGIDQGDLSRMLGHLDQTKVEQIVSTIERAYGNGVNINQRYSADVLAQLRHEMNRSVTSYPPHIYRVPDDPIVGTAFFPGGCGLWCGSEPWAPMPKAFPVSPVMFIAHNFSSKDEFGRVRAKGGEADWWLEKLLPLIGEAGVQLGDGFFTNVLMGLKDGSSLGNMKATPAFEEECGAFLAIQIEIINPSKIVVFGNDARVRVRKVTSDFAYSYHPSWPRFWGKKPPLLKIHAAKLRESLEAREPR